jgi:hypothetical protein
MEAHATKRKNGRARLQACQKSQAAGPTALPNAGAKAEGEATESIAFAVAHVFLSSFSAQKSHVKPQNPLTHYPTTTSEWHFSYPQTAILDIEEKMRKINPKGPNLTH